MFVLFAIYCFSPQQILPTCWIGIEITKCEKVLACHAAGTSEGTRRVRNGREDIIPNC